MDTFNSLSPLASHGQRHPHTPARNRIACQAVSAIGLFLLSACEPAPHISAPGQDLPLPTEVRLSREPALVRQWASRVMADDPKVRATAAARPG